MREHALGAGATQPPQCSDLTHNLKSAGCSLVGGLDFPLSGERALNHMIRMCRHESMSHSLHSMRMSSTAFCNHTEMHRTRRFLSGRVTHIIIVLVLVFFFFFFQFNGGSQTSVYRCMLRPTVQECVSSGVYIL